ncbi:MAG: excinuclease ABC subunit UvrA, partial [Rhodothermales bacterium]
RLLYARIGKTISPVSGEAVTKDSPRSVAEALHAQLEDKTRFYLCFPLPEHKKASVKQELEALLQRGFFRLVLLPTEKQAEKGKAEETIDLNETPPDKVRAARDRLLVLVDRLAIKRGDEANLSRIADSVEQAFREGGGRCIAQVAKGGAQLHFSEHFERDGMTFEEPTPLLFSFNSPAGACPTCQGFGRVPGIDPDLVIPNPDLSIRPQAIAPFRTEQWSKHFRDLIRVAANEKIDIDRPYRDLSEKDKQIVWDGKGDYVGVYGFFRFLEKKAYKMHYRIYHARFRGYSTCPDCHGYRLRPAALYVQVGGHHIGEVCELTTKDASDFFENLTLTRFEEEVAGRVMEEIRKRLRYLVDVGLDYLTLDRLSQTLSGGESQRINLATSLGSSLVGSLYVLDEPSIGLHPRDTGRLINILEGLRDLGNTVLVVEHEADVMRRADQIVDLGPGSGTLGGEVIFQGTYEEILEDEDSLTGAYLSGRREIPVPAERRPVDEERVITIENARQHNLKRLDVRFPLDMITCVTGVSGSGKSTLVHDTLYAGLRRLKGQHDGDVRIGAHDAIQGHYEVDAVEMVDQSPIGRTSRSNPVTYIKAFDGIRALLADTYQARIRGYKPGYFSFNVPGGRCEVCQGEGVVQIEMQFLADLYLECEACKGQRYKQDVLEVRYNGKNVAEMLAMTVDEAVAFFAEVGSVVNKLKVMQDIGLGYLTLGQPSNTLSGGEAQRIKLSAILGKTTKERTLYLFDEPTTGLHFDDIRKLITAFNRLVEDGHSVVIIEHNMDVIKCADWVIDLGPEGGRQGGFIVAEGAPEALAANEASPTGHFLRDVL